jgi:hypothetical protein
MSLLLLFLLPAMACTAPAGATIVSNGLVLDPAAVPLAPLSEETVVQTIAVIPSGSTTFSKDHSLQMQTGLAAATWNIQVYKNGIAAAQQPASGDAAFVSGYLLSYGTDNDVSLTVTVSGTIPDTPGAQITLLSVAELDGSGAPVPGSSITVSEPVASPLVPASPQGAAPSALPSGQGTAPSPTQSGRESAATLLMACAASAAALAVAGKRR